MKRNFIYAIIMVAALFSVESLKAQAACDDLKKENAYLKKALQVTTPTKTVTSSKIDFNLIKCEGNSKEQTVTLTLTLVNHDANQNFQFSEAKAIDLEGNEYPTYNITIGSARDRNKIYTDTPIKATFKFTKVLPSVKIFKLIPIGYYDKEQPGRSIEIEYKDLTINWN